MTRPRFSIGGCVYRLLVDARHATALAMLSRLSALGGDPDGESRTPLLAGVHYVHTSNLPSGRALWLREMIADRDLTWAISVDGDTTYDAQDLISEILIVQRGFAIGIAPVRIGGTESLCNVCIDDRDEQVSAALRPAGTIDGLDHQSVPSNENAKQAPGIGRRAYGHELQEVLKGDRKIASGGFGVAVFNLTWFRDHWPLPETEYDGISTLTVGEDIAFCRSVRKRGGRIAALAVRTDHYAYGEKQTR